MQEGRPVGVTKTVANLVKRASISGIHYEAEGQVTVEEAICNIIPFFTRVLKN